MRGRMTRILGQDTEAGKRAPGLYTIIAVKLGKSLLLLGLTVGIYSLIDEDLGDELERFLRFIRVDPEHAFFTHLGERLQSITPAKLSWFASGTLLYGLFLMVESVGLSLRAFWAAWLAIGETAFFIPIEIYDLLGGFSPTVLIILIVNVAMVWYLLRNRNRLFEHHVRPARNLSES